MFNGSSVVPTYNNITRMGYKEVLVTHFTYKYIISTIPNAFLKKQTFPKTVFCELVDSASKPLTLFWPNSHQLCTFGHTHTHTYILVNTANNSYFHFS